MLVQKVDFLSQKYMIETLLPQISDNGSITIISSMGCYGWEKIFPNVQELRGYKIALGSSSRNAKIILKKVALEEAFDAISDGTNISKSKPDPEVFLKAAEYLDLQPEECIVVEDAYAGIDAAKAGNMQAVGTGDAYSYAKVDYHIKKIEELLTILP